MNKPKVYLSGPITGCSYEECKYGWRKFVYDELANIGVVGISPMRAKFAEHFRSDSLYNMDPNGCEDHVLSTPKGLVSRDRWDTLRSDVLFVNFIGSERMSAGTMCEIGWADGARIPIVVAMEKGNIHDHAFVNEIANFVVPTLEEAVQVVYDLFEEGI